MPYVIRPRLVVFCCRLFYPVGLLLFALPACTRCDVYCIATFALPAFTRICGLFGALPLPFVHTPILILRAPVYLPFTRAYIRLASHLHA